MRKERPRGAVISESNGRYRGETFLKKVSPRTSFQKLLCGNSDFCRYNLFTISSIIFVFLEEFLGLNFRKNVYFVDKISVKFPQALAIL